MALKDRMKAARQSKNLTQEQLANKIGVAKSTYAAYEVGTREPNMLALQNIMEALECDANYLFQDEMNELHELNATPDEMESLVKKYRALDEYGKAVVDVVIEKEALRYNEQRHVESSIPVTLPMYTFNTEAAAEIITLPLATRAFAGGPGDFTDDDSFEDTDVRLSMTTRRADFLIKVSGRSMEPDYPDGCTVAVQAQDDIKVGQVGVFIVDGSGYVKVKGETCLESINPNGNEVCPALDGTIKCLGLVLGVVD